MTDPTMTAVLENVDRALNEQPPTEVARFAPTKYRAASSTGSLATIHSDIRAKTLNSLDDDIKRVEDHLLQLKAVRDELKRIIG